MDKTGSSFDSWHCEVLVRYSSEWVLDPKEPTQVFCQRTFQSSYIQEFGNVLALNRKRLFIYNKSDASNRLQKLHQGYSFVWTLDVTPTKWLSTMDIYGSTVSKCSQICPFDAISAVEQEIPPRFWFNSNISWVSWMVFIAGGIWTQTFFYRSKAKCPFVLVTW